MNNSLEGPPPGSAGLRSPETPTAPPAEQPSAASPAVPLQDAADLALSLRVDEWTALLSCARASPRYGHDNLVRSAVDRALEKAAILGYKLDLE